MMHVLCEEYETVYAACLLMTSAVLGVDFGYEVNAQGELEYVVQIEPEMLESLKAGEQITLGRPSHVERIQVFRLQIGNDELSKVVPAAYQKPINDTPKELSPLIGNSAVLTEPPDPKMAADTKPSLEGEQLADYGQGGNLTRQLPYGASSNSPTSSGTGSTGASAIPGADARYGTSQNFSVPPATGITRPTTATSATTSGSGTSTDGNTVRPFSSGVSPNSGTTTAPPSSSTSAGSGGNPSGYTGSSFSDTAGTASTGSTQGNSSNTASGRPYPGWGSPSSTGNNAAAAGGNSASPPASSSVTDSSFPRYGQSGAGGVSSSGSGSPSERYGDVSTSVGGTSSGYGASGPTSNGSAGAGQSGGNAAPPLNNGGVVYGSGNGQPISPSPLPTNGPSFNDPNWTAGTWNNSGSITSNNQNPMPPFSGSNGQYAQGQQNYNPSQPNGYGGSYPNNIGAGQFPQQGNYATGAPNYNGQNYPPNYVQPSNLTSPEYERLASLIKHTMQAENNQASTATLATNTTAKPAEEESPAAKEPPQKPEVGGEPPDWWQLLALGFLISVCANAYMFMTTQDFRRKYQDLLEDVRDLRTLSND